MPRRREGDWFAVPLAASAHAAGLVARAARGSTVFGYFFGPFRRAPSVAELRTLAPPDAILLTRFFDEALGSGRWPILGSSEDWQRATWPMPEFHVLDSQALTGASFAWRYSEDNPARLVGRRQIAAEEEASYPADYGLCQPELVEHLLGELLGIEILDEEGEEAEPLIEEGVRHLLLVPPDALERVRRELEASGFPDVEVLEKREDGLVDLEVFQGGPVRALRRTIDDVEAHLTAIARNAGGEYDGLEWALPNS